MGSVLSRKCKTEILDRWFDSFSIVSLLGSCSRVVLQNIGTEQVTMTLSRNEDFINGTKEGKAKRPGRSLRRRRNRKSRNLDTDRINASASMIQKRFREFLEIRYKKSCPNNFDDHDYINLEKVSSIPKNLLVSMDGTGYNALSLLGWFCCKMVDPVTREPVDEKVPIECAAKILDFIKNDRVLKKKKGHFKRRRAYTEVIDRCVKKAEEKRKRSG